MGKTWLEKYHNGKTLKQVTPFWRVVVPGTPLARKLSCGESSITELRSQEGIE